jgi:hypothetical protein
MLMCLNVNTFTQNTRATSAKSLEKFQILPRINRESSRCSYLYFVAQIQILRLDGLDPTICFGTGGRTGHTAVLVRDPNTQVLFVLEATDRSPYGEDLW